MRGAGTQGLAVVALVSACTSELAPVSPPPRIDATHASRTALAPRAEPVGPVADNARCVRCHVEIGAEWQASLHRQSWDDPVFLSAYAVEPLEFCRNCHAPETRRATADSSHVGVGCVTCHAVGECPEDARTPDAASPPPDLIALRTTAACAGCHEFDFPEPQEALMQSTLREHARSRHADKHCQDCHMPTVDGHKSHAFRVIDDPKLLASAVSASARVTAAHNLEISLRAVDTGHDVPTGDLFRRLVVRAVARGDNAARPEVLARAFRKDVTPRGPRRIQTGDTRLSGSGEPRVVSLFFLRPIELPLRWEVAYQRMGPEEAALFGVDLSRDETIVAAGVIERNEE